MGACQRQRTAAWFGLVWFGFDRRAHGSGALSGQQLGAAFRHTHAPGHAAIVQAVFAFKLDKEAPPQVVGAVPRDLVVRAFKQLVARNVDGGVRALFTHIQRETDSTAPHRAVTTARSAGTQRRGCRDSPKPRSDAPAPNAGGAARGTFAAFLESRACTAEHRGLCKRSTARAPSGGFAFFLGVSWGGGTRRRGHLGCRSTYSASDGRRGSCQDVVRELWSTKYGRPFWVSRISQPDGSGPSSGRTTLAVTITALSTATANPHAVAAAAPC